VEYTETGAILVQDRFPKETFSPRKITVGWHMSYLHIEGMRGELFKYERKRTDAGIPADIRSYHGLILRICQGSF
jgi:hypothetical protein